MHAASFQRLESLVRFSSLLPTVLHVAHSAGISITRGGGGWATRCTDWESVKFGVEESTENWKTSAYPTYSFAAGGAENLQHNVLPKFTPP